LSFQSRQISGRIYAEAKLPPAGFFTLVQVRTQVAPSSIIARSELLRREGLLLGDHGCDDANGTTDDYPSNGPTSARRSSLMDPCHPKAMFQIIIGPRQSLDVIALKQASREVVSDVTKVLNGLSQQSYVGFLLLHLANVCQVALSNLCPGVLLVIG